MTAISDDEKFAVLVDRYFDGRADKTELSQINATLRKDGEARRMFSEQANIDSALAEAAAGWEPQPQLVVMDSARDWQQRVPSAGYTLFKSLVAACVALSLLVGYLVYDSNKSFATVVADVSERGLTAGDRIHDGGLGFQDGTMELLTENGVNLVVEGPAFFVFESPQRMRLKYGRILADVPPAARGFTVVTPDGDAIDLGTTFGVDVSPFGDSEIHVFKGEVIAKPSGAGGQKSLRTGEAATLEASTARIRELRSAAFIHSDEIAPLRAAIDAGQESRARYAIIQLNTDPDLIAAFDFDGSSLPKGSYRIVQGRWPGSRAVEFVDVGHHMRIDIGGEKSYPQLSLAAWVRIDRLGAPYQSLLHTDGWSQDKPGQVHWMVNRDSTMRLALRSNTLVPGSSEKQGYPDSLTPVLSEQGRWVHLVTVYDSTKGTVRFFLNGKFDSESRQEIAHPARLGPAQIGNWDQRDRKLSGRIDELILLGRALDDHEVKELFEAGNPYARVAP